MSDFSDFNMIIKCILSGKDIYAYGDFTQLLPVGYDTQLDNKLMIDSLFNNQEEMKTNHRNKFTAEYYDSLRKSRSKQFLQGEVIKHSTNWEDAQFIIVYTNEIREKYNKLKMKKLNITLEDKGCKVICRSNNLREHNIYNKYQFTVSCIDKTSVKLIDGTDTIYEIKREDYNKYFEPSYAVTLYCVQGASIDSYYYPQEDYKYLNGRSTYTLISRLKR